MHFPCNCVHQLCTFLLIVYLHCTFCMWGVHMMNTFHVIMYNVHQYTLNLIVYISCTLFMLLHTSAVQFLCNCVHQLCTLLLIVYLHCTFCLWGVHMMDTFRVIMYISILWICLCTSAVHFSCDRASPMSAVLSDCVIKIHFKCIYVYL